MKWKCDEYKYEKNINLHPFSNPRIEQENRKSPFKKLNGSEQFYFTPVEAERINQLKLKHKDLINRTSLQSYISMNTQECLDFEQEHDLQRIRMSILQASPNINKTDRSNKTDVRTRLYKIQESESGSIPSDSEDTQEKQQSKRVTDVLNVPESSESDIEQIQQKSIA